MNIILAFVGVPMIKLVFDYFKIKNDNTFFLGTFLEYEQIMASTTFFILPFGFLVFILLTYNLLITQRKITLLRKIVLFELILILFICIVGTFSNIWMFPHWKNLVYLITSFIYSCFFSILIHIFIDKKTHYLDHSS